MIEATHFNPRAPCGARPRDPELRHTGNDFNPRAPCGARRGRPHGPRHGAEISIHAPRAGRDHKNTALHFV